jgi:pimeloyl-[acyl-carrier protein] synthase
MTVVDITAQDPFATPTKEFFQNPFPFYDRLREQGNVVWSAAGEPRWLVLSFEAAAKAFTDQRFSTVVPESLMADYDEVRHNVRYKDLMTGLTAFMLNQDPPQHTRVRRLANKAFTRAEVTQMSNLVEKTIDDLLDRVMPTGKMDLVQDFALPIPMTVICEVLGLPQKDRDQFRTWTESFARVLEPIINNDDIDPSADATTALFDYLKDLIAERRAKPGSDLLSAFIQAEEEGDRLTLDELLANMLLLILAGHETTVNLICNGTVCFLQNPDALQRVQTQPELLPLAIEEMLRYQSPVQATDRYVLEDMDFEGQHLKKSQRVSIIVGAANRDPKQFELPHEFNIDRQPNKHLAFGQGIHFCLGAPLARFEAKFAFEKLLSRVKNLQFGTEQLDFRESAAFRGLHHLPLRFDPE